MDSMNAFGDVANIIQLSVAPVFLLVAVGSFLNVVTGRLGRVVDRARYLEERLMASGAKDSGLPAMKLEELKALDRRMSFNHWSINFSSLAALLVAILVGVLFVSDFAGADASGVLAFVFILSMTSFVIGICFFLAEIYLATRTVRVSSDLLRDRRDRAGSGDR